MRHAIGLLALAASAVARPQGVAEGIAPSAPPPSGCSEDYPGNFQITVVNVTTSASKLRKRQGATPLELTLNGGVLKDSQGRTGSIVANYQFQFDGPPQAGAIYTGGFSVCGNGTMALGGSAIFYQCYSGGFYNLYDRHWADQCSPIYIEVIGHSSSASGGSSGGTATQAADGQPGVASQIPDGQVQATPAPVGQIGDGQVQMAPPAVGQIGDGQVQAGGVSQIADGQVQATPAGQISDGQVQATPAGQIGDGQVQASPAAPAPAPAGQIGDGQVQASPVGQISDGQVQATSAAAAPVGQIGDGQVQATSAAVGQIGDGQVQASAPAVGQASDGQVQATSAASPAVQIGDGQVQQQASATATGGPVQQTVNAAPGLAVDLPAAVAGLLAAVALL